MGAVTPGWRVRTKETQRALHRARACALGFLSRKQLQLKGPHLHLQTRCWGFRGGLGLVKSGWGTGMGPLPTGLASHEWWPRKGTMARKGHRVGGWTLRRALHLLLTHSGDLGSHCWREDGCRLEAASSPKGLGCLRYLREAGMVVVGVAWPCRFSWPLTAHLTVVPTALQGHNSTFY